VCSEPFDHTSNLMLLEKITGVEAPNISDWRRKTFGDFTSAFRFRGKPADPSAMPDTTGDLYLSEYEVATLPAPTAPTANQVPPAQAPGHRPVTPPSSGARPCPWTRAIPASTRPCPGPGGAADRRHALVRR
jgi:phospholipase C